MSLGSRIAAAPADWAVHGLRTYVRWRVPRAFHGWHFRAEDLDALRETDTPILFVPNHTSWWDGFFGLEIAAHVQQRYFVMMQRDQLANIPFFARCGAFSLDRDNPRQALRDLQYAATLLMPGNGVWVFPQGVRSPAHAPLVLESGVGRLASWSAPVRVVPVAFRYQFLSEDLPEAFAWLGKPRLIAPGTTPDAALALIRTGMHEVLGKLDTALATTEREGFTALIAGSPSVNKRVDHLKATLGLIPKSPLRNG